MNKYRVVLQLPESITDGEVQTFTTEQEAEHQHVAVMRAQAEAANAFMYYDLKTQDFRVLDVVRLSSDEPTTEQCKLCLIERVSEFAFENVESYRNDTTGVAADLAYLLWAIAADSSFLWGNEKPDGLIKLMLENDTELLKELMDKGYIIKEMLPVPEKPEPLDEKRHIAEIAAVVAEFITDHKIKLGNEGMITHYATIAEIALEFDEFFPSDFDWEKHMDKGGDCWDMEVRNFTEGWIVIHNTQVGEWD